MTGPDPRGLPRRVAWAPVVFLLTAVAELSVFVLVAREIGFGLALLAVLGLSIVGLVLLRREGVRAWRRFRRATDRGEPPGRQVSDGVVGLVGALLLAVPGFVTGLLGLLVLVPPVRTLARGRVMRATERRVSAAVAGDLFGPRRVRVRRGAPTASTAGPDGDADGAPPQPGGPDIEGEIVDAPRVDPGPAGPSAQT